MAKRWSGSRSKVTERLYCDVCSKRIYRRKDNYDEGWSVTKGHYAYHFDCKTYKTVTTVERSGSHED